MHWHIAGPRACSSLRLPQWVWLERHCTKPGRMFLLVALPDLVPGTLIPRDIPSLANPREGFIRGRTWFGTHVQTPGTSTSGSWLGCEKPEWAITSGTIHYHSSHTFLCEVAAYFQVAFFSSRKGQRGGYTPPPWKSILAVLFSPVH